MNSIILHICLVCLQNLYVLCRIKYIWMEILRQRRLKISIEKRSFMRWETFSQFPAVSRREQIKIWSWQTSEGSALQIMIFQEVHKAIKLYISAEINEIPILLCYKPELWSSALYSLLLPSPQKTSFHTGLCLLLFWAFSAHPFTTSALSVYSAYQVQLK